VLCFGYSAKGCGTARMSRQADEVARASWAELWRASLSLGGRALLCAAINAVTAVELFSKADGFQGCCRCGFALRVLRGNGCKLQGLVAGACKDSVGLCCERKIGLSR
jgi:hypothetical protein